MEEESEAVEGEGGMKGEGEGERKRGRKSGREGERDAKGNNNL